MELDAVATLDADWMLDLLGIPISATRRKCALLSLKAMRAAITGEGSWPE
jgi:nitrogen fixation NifU-like protein